MAGLTQELIDAVTSSWDAVRANVKENGIDFYINMFRHFPAYQAYFGDFAEVPLEELRSNRTLRMHGVRVLYALSSMVDSLDELDVAAQIMVKTINDHYSRGMRAIHYENLFSIIPQYMEDKAGDKFDAKAREGWGLVLNTLLAVAKERLAELDEQEQSVNPQPKLELNAVRIKAVVRSWDKVRENTKDNGVDFFVSFFTNFPDYQDYFKDFKGVPLAELHNNRKLRMHGTRVIYALSSMVDSLDELDVAAQIMIKTVDDHYSKGMREAHYTNLFSIMPKFMTLKAADTFDQTAQEGWGLVIDTLTSVVTQRLSELKLQETAEQKSMDAKAHSTTNGVATNGKAD